MGIGIGRNCFQCVTVLVESKSELGGSACSFLLCWCLKIQSSALDLSGCCFFVGCRPIHWSLNVVGDTLVILTVDNSVLDSHTQTREPEKEKRKKDLESECKNSMIVVIPGCSVGMISSFSGQGVTAPAR